MEKLAPNVVNWVKRMQNASPDEGEFLADDQIPETLLPVLSRMWREQMPVLVDTARIFSKWFDENSGESEVPRVIGQHAFELEGMTEQRIVLPYSLWMIQRPLDYLGRLNVDESDQVNQFLDALGDKNLRQFPDFPRLTRKNFELVVTR